MKAYTFIVLALFGALFWGCLIDAFVHRIGEGSVDGNLAGFAAAMTWTCFVRPLGKWLLSKS